MSAAPGPSLEARVPPEWRGALDDLSAAPVVLVLGAAETGKTTFTAWLAGMLHGRGLDVAIVDADVGQSEIGPPATVGYGRVRGPLMRTGDAETVAFEFVGVTSPGRRPWDVVAAAGRVATRARTDFDRVVVDTSGFIAGGFAAAVKQRKIVAVDPDLVVLIQRNTEAEHIVRRFVDQARPRLIRLPAVRGLLPRTAVTRRRHREAAFARHLEGARTTVLDLRRVRVRAVTGREVPPERIPAHAIVAVHARDGATLALGVVEAIDIAAGTLRVRTTRAATEIGAVTVGEITAL